jgi:hypothetical protein
LIEKGLITREQFMKLAEERETYQTTDPTPS